ncbi:MAG: hypothetical protein AB7T31_16700 [Gemmatimonadales bacterium]
MRQTWWGRWSRRAIGVGALAACACGGDPEQAPASAGPAAASSAPLAPCLLEQSPLLAADGTELYIEPQNLFALGDAWVVAGAPSYRWGVAPGRDAVRLQTDAHVAAVVARPAVPIARPRAARTGSVIATPLGDGRWAAIFDEIHPDSIPGVFSPLSWWYGEHDGTRWTLVEPLPVPPASRLLLRQSSNLVRAGDRLVWIGYDDAERASPAHMYRYERGDGTWRYERMPDEFVEVAVLEYDDGAGLWMLLVGLDEELPGFQKSIRLYREGRTRELVARVTAEPGADRMISWPSMQIQDGAVHVSWVVSAREGSRAFVRSGIRSGVDPGPIVELDDNAPHLRTLTMPDGSPAWIAEHLDPVTQQKELRVLRLDGTRILRAAAVPSPFTGFFSARARDANDIVLVGPQMGRVSPETPVRSLVLRLSTSC